MTDMTIAPTGSALCEFDVSATWKAADQVGSRWVTTRPRYVENSSLRDALCVFDAALSATSSLRLFLGGSNRIVEIVADRGEVTFDWLVMPTVVGLGGVGSYRHAYPLPVPYDVDLLVCGVTSNPDPVATTAAIAAAEPVQIGDSAAIGTTIDTAVGAGDAGLLNGQRGAVTVVEQLTSVLGMPKRDVLQAAGISKSTFHTWDKPHGPKPRLASQGRLWALAEMVQDLSSFLGGPDKVGRWLVADDSRLSLLQTGAFDVLIDLAAPTAVADTGVPYLAGLFAAGEEKQPPSAMPGAAARRRGRSAVTATARRVRRAQPVAGCDVDGGGPRAADGGARSR